MITTDQVKALRDKTGVSVMQCKKALEEAEGNEEKAMLFLRKKSAEVAAKKSDREFGSGKVASYIHANGAVGVLLELVTETDFVAGNEEFAALANDVALHIAAMNPKYINEEEVPEEDKTKMLEVIKEESSEELEGKPEEIQQKILDGKMQNFYKESVLLNQDFVKDPDMTIQVLIQNHVQKFGERMEVARFKRFALLEG